MTSRQHSQTIPSVLRTQTGIPPIVWAGLAACVVILVLHIIRYRFLCDDAFISFRYARNFAQGYGLVFNPGFERVEGYSNFLWVLILAAAQLFEIPPEAAANPIASLLGVALVAIGVWFCHRERPAGASAVWLLVPALFLATNRSFAVWCTSGLETKLFEFLVVTGILLTLREMHRSNRQSPDPFPFSLILLALATLTRPDGMLIGLCVIFARLACQAWSRTLRWQAVLRGFLCFALPVAAHLLFRRVYYDDWVPNTYYAKVGGRSWWEMGWKYLLAFVVEYAAFLWIPLFLFGAAALFRLRRLAILIVILAAIVPHVLYIAAIGGDHFEYRPLDVYLPLLGVVFYFGLAHIGRGQGTMIALGAYAALTIAAGMVLPDLSHRSFPSEYRTGFPGLTPRDDYRTDLVDSVKFPGFFRAPLIGRYAVWYNDLIYDMARQFVGLRQEEHAGFLATAIAQGKWIRGLIENGRLPPDTHIAVDCVGAVPYYCNLRTLDRLGLTDREAALHEDTQQKQRVMAHDKRATPEYTKKIGVDLSAVDAVHLILPARHPKLLFFGHKAQLYNEPWVYADLGGDYYLVANPIQGIDALRAKMPRLNFRPAAELVALETSRDGGRFAPVPRDRQFGAPYDMTYFDQGMCLYDEGFIDAMMQHWACALATNPDNAQAQANAPQIAQWKQAKAAGLSIPRLPPRTGPAHVSATSLGKP